MGYQLEGRAIEVCTCDVIWPYWVGRDPDDDTCDGLVAYHFTAGEIGGVDVSGLTLGIVAAILSEVPQGYRRLVVLLDDAATREQEAALVEVFAGNEGGPVADLTGGGRFEIVTVHAAIEPLIGATFSPAYVARSTNFSIDAPTLGIKLDVAERSTVGGAFRFEHAA